MTTQNAVYTGLAIDQAGTRLYAANGAGGTIDVFDSSFAPVSIPGGFKDPNLPAGYVPFNVEDINGKIYVTYAPSGLSNQRHAQPGQGIVSVFDENGKFEKRLITTGSELAAPWGLALAPSGFGQFGGDLLGSQLQLRRQQNQRVRSAKDALNKSGMAGGIAIKA